MVVALGGSLVMLSHTQDHPEDPAAAYTVAMDTYAVDKPLTQDQVRQIGYDVCQQALGQGGCADYTVTVEDLDGPVGRTEVHVQQQYSSAGDVVGSTVTTGGIVLDPTLTDQAPQYVAHVAAHEWNHVEQALAAPSAPERAALSKRADELFGARSGAVGDGDGLEVLADCMAVLGDGVSPGEGEVPFYIQSLMQDPDVGAACEGWAGILEAPDDGGGQRWTPWRHWALGV